MSTDQNSEYIRGLVRRGLVRRGLVRVHSRQD